MLYKNNLFSKLQGILDPWTTCSGDYTYPHPQKEVTIKRENSNDGFMTNLVHVIMCSL